MAHEQGAPGLSRGRRIRRTAATAGLTLLLLIYVGNLLLTRYVFDALPAPVLPPLTAVEGVGTLSVKQCSRCHPDAAREWAASRHAVAQTNAVYQADLAQQGSPFFCAYCHTPLVAQRPHLVDGLSTVWPRLRTSTRENPDYQPALRDEGVNCVACHQRDGALVGTRHVEAPHPTRAEPDFGGVTNCAPCHRFDISVGTELQRPIIDTLAEWALYRRQGGTEQCVDCHMPMVTRPVAVGRPSRPTRNHRVLGPRDPDFVAAHLQIDDLKCVIDEHGVTGTVTLTNGAGHNFPTADPARSVDVIIDGRGADARPVQVARARLQRYIDLDRYLEPPDRDTSLAPGERRAVSLKTALPKSLTTAEIIVRFVIRDVTDPLAVAAGLDPAELAYPLGRAKCNGPGAPVAPTQRPGPPVDAAEHQVQ